MGKHSPFATLGVHTDKTTKNRPTWDYYSTPPSAVEWLLKYEKFSNNVWECACGEGKISETLKEHGFNVKSSDIHNYGYDDTEIIDFTKAATKWGGDIITNPPYMNVIPFVQKAYELCENKFAMLLKIQFLETIQRHKSIFSKIPPARVYVFTKRISCLKNGTLKDSGSAVCYCWFVWDKKYTGKPTIQWIPNYLTDKTKQKTLL